MAETSEYSQRGGIWVLVPVVGILVFAFTALFSMIYWFEDINTTMTQIPEWNYYAFFVLWVLLSIAGLLFGGEITRTLGVVGLAIIGFAVGMTLAFELPQYLVPILLEVLPSLQPTTWAILGLGTAVVLVGVGFAMQHRGRT